MTTTETNLFRAQRGDILKVTALPSQAKGLKHDDILLVCGEVDERAIAEHRQPVKHPR